MKLLGMMLIISAFVGTCFDGLRAEKKRICLLRDVCRSLKLMDSELSSRSCSLEEMLVSVSADTCRDVHSFFLSLYGAMNELGEQEFSAIWKDKAKEIFGGVNAEALDALCNLGCFLGRYGLDRQLSAIRQTAAHIEHMHELEYSNYLKMKKLKLSVSGALGAMLIIVLI